MLTHFDSIIAQIKVTKENRIEHLNPKNNFEKEYAGRSALNVLLADYLAFARELINIDELGDDDLETEELRIPYRWRQVYNHNLESLPHYFRYYYTLVKFIMTSDKRIDRRFYANLLQAKMSSSEMGLIFYNTFL